MPHRTRIQIQNGPSATLAATREAILAGMAAVAQAWHTQFLPMHFTVQGGKRYNYQPRSGDDEPPMLPNPGYSANRALGFNAPKMRQNWHYSWAKRRLKKHNRPLVWSGRSEQMAMASVRISARRRGGMVQSTAAMDLPRYFYQYLRAGIYQRRVFKYDEKGRKYVDRITNVFVSKNQPDKYDELTRVIPSEEAALAVIAERVVFELLTREHDQQTVTI